MSRSSAISCPQLASAAGGAAAAGAAGTRLAASVAAATRARKVMPVLSPGSRSTEGAAGQATHRLITLPGRNLPEKVIMDGYESIEVVDVAVELGHEVRLGAAALRPEVLEARLVPAPQAPGLA